MFRRIAMLGGAIALVLSTMAIGPARAASTETCQLKGAAHFTPGLKGTGAPTSYTFSGNFTGCKSATGIKSGTVTASGFGAKLGCVGAKSNGTAKVTWNTGQTSGISFSTGGQAPLITVKGTFTSGAFAGKKAAAYLVFQAAPQECATTGVSNANFTGVAKLG
jgi:hypothetical protein